MENFAEEFVAYARQWLGVPYVYGGNSPFGWDCSGAVCFWLRKFGIVGSFEDLAAQSLYEKLKAKAGSTNYPVGSLIYPKGAVVFYGNSTSNITHVAVVADRYSVIEAGGGTSKTDSIEKAKAIGACTREVSLRFRSDIVAVILPG